MKKFFTLMLFCSFASFAFADVSDGTTSNKLDPAEVGYDFIVDGIYYKVLETNSVSTSEGENPYSGKIVIPDEVTYDGVTYKVTKVSGFRNSPDVTEITIPKYTKTISGFYGAYSYWKGSPGIKSPESRTTGAESKTDTTDEPSKLTKVFFNAIDCQNAYYSHFSTTMLGGGYSGEQSAFPPTVTDIVFGENVTRIPNGLLIYCPEIKEVVFPESVKYIGWKIIGTEYDNVSECRLLCKDLQEIAWLPVDQSCVSLGTDFHTYPCGMKHYRETLLNGYKDSSTYSDMFHKFLGISNDGTAPVVLPEWVWSIAPNSFADCDFSLFVELPESIESISAGAFANCSALEEITIPESVTSIGAGAFNGCKNLKAFYFNAINCGDASATLFLDCTSLEQIVFGPKVKRIPSYFADDCDKLEEITIPESIVHIGEKAFNNCNKMKTVYFNAVSCTEAGNGVFGGTTSLNSVILGSDVKVIPQYLFYCENLTQVTIPESVTEIGSRAFDGNPIETLYFDAIQCDVYDDSFSKWALTDVVFGENVQKISAYMLAGSHISEITIPKSMTQIGGDAFANCEKLTTVYFNAEDCNTFSRRPGHESNASNNGIFYGCELLSEVVIGKTVTRIPDYFLAYNNIKQIAIPESVSVIGAGAFSGTGLTSIVIPKGVTYIGEFAFSDCNDITEVISLRADPPVADETAFVNTCEVASLIVPAGSQTLYKEAVGWRNFANIYENGSSEEDGSSEWSEWSSLGVAVTTNGKETVISNLQYWGEGPITVWEEPIAIDKRTNMVAPSRIQLRLNKIFNDKDIILEYDPSTSVITAEKQSTGYAINVSELISQGISDPYDEFLFYLGAGTYFPETGVLDLSNAFFMVNDSFGLNLGFSLLIQDATPPTFDVVWDRDYVGRQGGEARLTVNFGGPIVKYRKLVLAPGESITVSDVSALYAANPETDLEYEEIDHTSISITCTEMGTYRVIFVPIAADGTAVMSYQLYQIASYAEPEYESYEWEYIGESSVTEHVGSLLIPSEYRWKETDGSLEPNYPWMVTSEGVETYRRVDNPNIIGLRNLYGKDHPYSSMFRYIDQSLDWWVYIDITEPDNVQLMATPVGALSSEVGYSSFINQYPSEERATCSDGVITFPKWTILLNNVMNQDYDAVFDMRIILPKNIESDIDEIGTEHESVEYFDLQGRRIDKPGRGLYIECINGKAVKRFF